MEVTGLVIGIAGLAGLFKTCLEVVDAVESYNSFKTDWNILKTRFQVAKFRFRDWGLRTGIDQGKLGPNQHSSAHDRVRCELLKTLFHIIVHDFGNEKFLDNGVDGSIKQKLNWAIRRKGICEEQVETFTNLVDTLYTLAPPDVENAPFATSSAGIANIQQTLDGIQARNKRELEKEIYSWIGGSQNERYQDSLRQRLSGTCDWVFQRPVFREWLGPEFASGPKFLWLNGRPGFGKTVLCAKIVQDLSRAPEKLIDDQPRPFLNERVAHFFFSSDIECRNNPSLALRSWITQLMKHEKGAFELVREKWEIYSDPIKMQATALEIRDIFTQLLHAKPGCSLIADGLDECSSYENNNKSVKDFLDYIGSSIAGTKTRLLLVSRDELHIRDGLQENVSGGFTEYNITAEDVQSEIALLSDSIINKRLCDRVESLRSSLDGDD
ncbi:hypothetical protein H9Q72_004972 [Fusarium xylarioides]|uniref:NACHT domain-containing protein n=1 Tax=Fusarium xylarioides TaxID=221167 RepID=A0A9P7I138_9HYPO|nr:hypothetical protein H9Q72_004972 [Fusarium xylarioides]